MNPNRSTRAVAIGTSIAIAAMFTLSGCSVLDSLNPPAPTMTTMTSAGTESSQTPTPVVPTTTPTVAPAQFLPVGLGCAQLLPDEFVFEFSPNFARQDDYTPDGNSTDGYIAANQGVACRIVNLSGGDHVDVAVASMDAAGMAELTAKLSSTQASVGDFGGNVQGYFTDAGGVGQASALTSKYWVVVSSPLFTQARDAAPIIAQVLSALG
jgi:hypothetical protein